MLKHLMQLLKSLFTLRIIVEMKAIMLFTSESLCLGQRHSVPISGFLLYPNVQPNQVLINRNNMVMSSAQQQRFVPSQFCSSVQSNHQPFGQSNVSPNALHMANHRGNQPGHDAYKRSDSSTPSSSLSKLAMDHTTRTCNNNNHNNRFNL